jgi:hypothetical protein
MIIVRSGGRPAITVVDFRSRETAECAYRRIEAAGESYQDTRVRAYQLYEELGRDAVRDTREKGGLIGM